MHRTAISFVATAFAVACLSVAPAARAQEIPSYYANIDNLDYSAVSIMQTILSSRDVIRVMNAGEMLGAKLCRIAYLSGSGDGVSFELRFLRQGSWGGPPPAPWRATVRVDLKAPADGSLQVWKVHPAKIVNANPPEGWYHF